MYQYKYSPTNELVEHPISYCAKPKIKYNSKFVSAFWDNDEFKYFLNFVTQELDYKLYVWGFNESDKIRTFGEIKPQNITQYFLKIYLTKEKLNTDTISKSSDELGIYIKNDLWRKHPLIEVAYYNIGGLGKQF